jgi:hypothetical protein
LLRADFPQQMVIDLIQQKMKPKQMEATTAPASSVKPVVKRRRTRRRH